MTDWAQSQARAYKDHRDKRLAASWLRRRNRVVFPLSDHQSNCNYVMKSLLLTLMLVSGGVAAQTEPATIRMCDDTGCSLRPRGSAAFDPTHDAHPEETRRLNALIALAEKDPRAAYDLALRFFRGDGVRRDSYQALQWMRDAGDRGVSAAYLALGRWYMMGLEEMGPDPVEAEKWLSLAAAGGDKEADKLLVYARKAQASEHALYQWRQANRQSSEPGWRTDGAYQFYWAPGGWRVR